MLYTYSCAAYVYTSARTPHMSVQHRGRFIYAHQHLHVFMHLHAMNTECTHACVPCAFFFLGSAEWVCWTYKAQVNTEYVYAQCIYVYACIMSNYEYIV